MESVPYLKDTGWRETATLLIAAAAAAAAAAEIEELKQRVAELEIKRGREGMGGAAS